MNALAKGGVQHEDFPGGHPSYYYSRSSTLNFDGIRCISAGMIAPVNSPALYSFIAYAPVRRF